MLGIAIEGRKSGSRARLSTVRDSRRLSRVPQDEFIGFIIKRGSQYPTSNSFIIYLSFYLARRSPRRIFGKKDVRLSCFHLGSPCPVSPFSFFGLLGCIRIGATWKCFNNSRRPDRVTQKESQRNVVSSRLREKSQRAARLSGEAWRVRWLIKIEQGKKLPRREIRLL